MHAVTAFDARPRAAVPNPSPRPDRLDGAVSATRALARWPSGVAVATRATGDGGRAVLARSFASVSLAPPLCALVVDDATGFAPGDRFTVSLLAIGQQAILARFAGTRTLALACLPERAGPDDAPRLAGCCAWLHCTVHAVHRAGTSAIVLGRVSRVARAAVRPLLATDAGPMACVPLCGESR